MSWMGDLNLGLCGLLLVSLGGLVLFAGRVEGEGVSGEAPPPPAGSRPGESASGGRTAAPGMGASEVSRDGLREALADLKAKVEKAQAQNLPTLYAEVPLTVGMRFVEQDWDSRRIGNRRADWAAFLLRQIRYESQALDDLLAGKPDPRRWPSKGTTSAWTGSRHSL